MAEKINDGGPAFPVPPKDGHQYYTTGLSLRDWFAGQAINGQLVGLETWTSAMIAENAYELADAMLAAREPK